MIHNDNEDKKIKSRFHSKDNYEIFMKNGPDKSSESFLSSKFTDQNQYSSVANLTNESSFRIMCQVTFPLLVAGFGMVLAGLLLDYIQDTVVFRKVSQIFILVPALLGLKGNIEMTMASRLSSTANMGLLKSQSQRIEIFKANIALTQVSHTDKGMNRLNELAIHI